MFTLRLTLPTSFLPFFFTLTLLVSDCAYCLSPPCFFLSISPCLLRQSQSRCCRFFFFPFCFYNSKWSAGDLLLKQHPSILIRDPKTGNMSTCFPVENLLLNILIAKEGLGGCKMATLNITLKPVWVNSEWRSTQCVKKQRREEMVHWSKSMKLNRMRKCWRPKINHT